MNVLLDTIFTKIKEGKNPSTISKDLNISKQKTNYYIRRLKKEGLIEKKGYAVWEVKNSSPNTLTQNKKKEIRGHAFIWTIKIPRNLNLKERAIKIGKLTKSKVVRLIIKNHKVWIGKKNIIVYESKSFYANNSINSRKYAVISLIEVLKEIEKKLNVNIKPYIFKPSREHYGMIKNDLAIQCNKQKEKIIVHDDLEGDWLWIDDSESLGELETGGKKAVVRSKQVQDWWNDNKKHGFKVTPSFIIQGFMQSQNQLNQFSKQISEHLKLIKEYRKENIRWRKSQKQKLERDMNAQTKLGDFF